MLPDASGIGCICVYLVALVDSFQLLCISALHFERIERQIDRIKQPGSLQILDSRQVATAFQPEMSQESRCRCIGERPAGDVPPPRWPDPAGFHEDVEGAFRNLDPANGLDLGAAHRFMIGNDSQRLDPCARKLARFLAFAAQDMGKIGRSLK